MRAFFELIKGVFYLIVLAVAILYTIWNTGIFRQQSSMVLQIIRYLLPMVLLFSGVVMSYTVAMMVAKYHGNDLPTRQTFVKTTIIGLFIGIACAILYGIQTGVLTSVIG